MIDESTLIDIKPNNDENNTNTNVNKTTKEILSNLLKKMLDHKLSKLEKKHIEESNTLKGMSKISQNIILSLDYFSHKVRKELYKIRHKNDENTNKKISKENNINNKSLLKEEKNNLESLENILENNLNNISSIAKTKRASKSIEAKKAKELILTPELNNKEKKIKKEKTDVFSRLASKSIGNFKKHKYTMTDTSKSKNKKLNLSKKKSNNNLINKKDEIINSKEDKDTPSRPEKKMEKEKILKLTSTPKSKQKLKRFSQMNLESSSSTNTLSVTNNTSRLKKMNSKGKIKKLKKEEKKNNLEENDLNEISVVNKINEINIENVILTDKNIKESNSNNITENKKEALNEKIFIDDEILKNVNKDELLISSINTNIVNNNDATIKDFSLKKSTNTIYENNINNNININNNNNLQKKISTEIINSVNSYNQSDKNINNIKLITTSEQVQNKEKEKEKEEIENTNIININDLDNIILPKKINNFLENEKEINFSLINYSNDNIDEHDPNKTIDLSVLSEHLSLEEKFEGHLDEITRYLDIPELCNIMLVNKECYTTIMNILISKTEITIDILEEEITKLKESNTSINFDEVKINPFSFSSNSTRAISLLNNSSGFNLINTNNKASKEIFIIFGIFFIAVGKKKEYLSLVTEEQKINFISNYFKKDVSLGNLIENEIKGKIFDDKTIASLYKYSYRYINIISPNRFQRINKDFAIFVFVVKNILEHIGALDQNIKPEKEYVLYNARLKNNKEMLEILNDYYGKIG